MKIQTFKKWYLWLEEEIQPGISLYPHGKSEVDFPRDKPARKIRWTYCRFHQLVWVVTSEMLNQHNSVRRLNGSKRSPESHYLRRPNPFMDCNYVLSDTLLTASEALGRYIIGAPYGKGEKTDRRIFESFKTGNELVFSRDPDAREEMRKIMGILWGGFRSSLSHGLLVFGGGLEFKSKSSLVNLKGDVLLLNVPILHKLWGEAAEEYFQKLDESCSTAPSSGDLKNFTVTFDSYLSRAKEVDAEVSK